MRSIGGNVEEMVETLRLICYVTVNIFQLMVNHTLLNYLLFIPAKNNNNIFFYEEK